MTRYLSIAAILCTLIVACGDDTTFFPLLIDAHDGATVGADGGSGSDSGGLVDAGGPADAIAGSDIAADAESSSTSPLVDPTCLDGRYSEALPPVGADISGLISSYSSSAYARWIIDVLEARYPVGAFLVEGGLESSSMGDCIETFVRDTSSALGIIAQLSLFVHECGHFYDMGLGGFSEATYVVTDRLTIVCRGGDTTARGGETFARSLINRDDRAALRPPCVGDFGSDCDFYADMYLDGDPFDGRFEGGDQGFNSLLEEAFQYVNSLATAYAFNDLLRGASVSERDGILTFLWWLERYLRYARLELPETHAFILGDACWREAILTLWGRAWLYLEATESMRHLGIDAPALLPLVQEPELLEEIDRVRAAEGCP